MVYPLHKLEFLYIFDDAPLNLDIKYRVLSRKELLNLHNLYYKENSPNNLLKIQTVKQALLDKEIINYLSDEQINDLYEKIISISNTSPDDLKLLKKLFWISQDEQLSNENWDCEVCKEKGLQEERNCPMITDKPKYIGVFFGNEYFFCPKYDLIKHSELINSGFLAYQMLDKGILPEQGGLYDQTNWFIDSALLIKNLVSEKERKEIEKINKD